MTKPRTPETPPLMDIGATLTKVRAARIRAARARDPQPTYEQIAIECGCSVKTVHNVVTGKTHGG